MLNYRKISQHRLECVEKKSSVVLIEHPGWFEFCQIRNGKESQKYHFPLRGLKGRTLQEEVKHQIKNYIKHTLKKGYVDKVK